MNKLNKLISLCKAGIHITINNHKGGYESVSKYFDDLRLGNGEIGEDIDSEVMKEMIARDTIAEVQAYPDTPIGFFCVYHYDVDVAMKEVIKAIEYDRKVNI